MNYQKHYNNLIDKAKNRIIDGYVETHHILPKCLGGVDSKENLVILTAREHFIAHALLAKIWDGTPNGYKLASAFRYMSVDSHSGNRQHNHDYEWMRKLYSRNHPTKNSVIVEKIRIAAIKQAHERRIKKRIFDDMFIGPIFAKPAPKLGKKKFQPKQTQESNKKRSITLKQTLSMLSPDELSERSRKSCLLCDQTKRADAIKRAKSSELKMTNIDKSEIVFHTYDDVKILTGMSYSEIKYIIKIHSGYDKHGRHFEYVKKYRV